MSKTLTVLVTAASIMMAHDGFGDCSLPDERPHKEFARDNPTYHTQAFVNKVKSMMGDRFMGYSVALQGRRGKLSAFVNYGWARTPCALDGFQKFNTDTQAAWGSVTKAITATAVMRKVERRQNRALDDKILTYLPLE